MLLSMVTSSMHNVLMIWFYSTLHENFSKNNGERWKLTCLHRLIECHYNVSHDCASALKEHAKRT
jgi:hypothetical protein